MRERSVAANSFLQIATRWDLITRLARRERRKRNLYRFLSLSLKAAHPRRSSQAVSARFYHNALQGMGMKKAYFISPIINMQNLIEKMMSQAHVSEEELRDKSEPNAELKKNSRESIFATPKSIPLAGRRRRIFYTAKKDRPSSFETICEFAQIRSAQCLPSEKRGASVLHS